MQGWIVMLALLAGASAGEPVQPWAVTVPSLVKLRSDSPLVGEPNARLTLARGECEGLQILTRPEVTEATLEAKPLRLNKGDPLQLRWYRIGFVPVKTPSNSEGAAGLWADPLVPLEASRSFSAPRLAFYGEVCAPATAQPGNYETRAVLESAHRPSVALGIEVTVEPFTLPATSSLPNSFGISLYSIAKGHRLNPESEEARELLQAYARALLAHRLSAHGMSMQPPPARVEGASVTLDFRDYDRELKPFLLGTALSNGARFSSTELRLPRTLPNDSARTAYAKAFREHLATLGWKGQLFFYAKDEPKPQDFAAVLADSRVMRAAKVPVLVTHPDDPELTPAADVLAPTLNCFFPARGPQTCPQVRAVSALRGKGPSKVWWYQSCNSHGCTGGPTKTVDVERAYSGWASYMVDHPAPLNRAMGPLAALAGVDGELYFDTVYAYNAQDPWKDVFAFGGNGDGTLFYPGTPAVLGKGQPNQPILSLRLKHIRDGLEDLEYLRLLETAGGGGGKALATTFVRRWVKSGDEVLRDPREWMAVRLELTQRLRELWTRRNNAGRSASATQASP
jgi:hypothetical protein